MFDYEKEVSDKGFPWVIGIDEAGRGPLAGPVVAAAVILKRRNFSVPIRDSKKISPVQREKAFHEILANSYVGVGIISEAVIDQLNILEATFLAMRNAVEDVLSKIDFEGPNKKVFLLIDGNRFKSDLPYAYRTIVRGDDLVLSIACASIVAKVTRDRILCVYDRIFPEYGFKEHKGYPTQRHRKMIQRLGPSMIQRKTFRS